MSKQWQIRRGTTAQNDSFTGAEGELTMDTTLKGLRIHDGSTEGGIEVPTAGTADYVVEFQAPTALNGYTWYRKYKSGWVEQGGWVASNSDADQQIILPIEMSDDMYYVNAHSKSSATSRPSDTNSANHNTVFFYSKVIYNQTTTGFNIGSATEMSISGSYWRVEGMSAQGE